MKRDAAENLVEHAKRRCQRYRVDWNILKEIILERSGWNPKERCEKIGEVPPDPQMWCGLAGFTRGQLKSIVSNDNLYARGRYGDLLVPENALNYTIAKMASLTGHYDNLKQVGGSGHRFNELPIQFRAAIYYLWHDRREQGFADYMKLIEVLVAEGGSSLSEVMQERWRAGRDSIFYNRLAATFDSDFNGHNNILRPYEQAVRVGLRALGNDNAVFRNEKWIAEKMMEKRGYGRGKRKVMEK